MGMMDTSDLKTAIKIVVAAWNDAIDNACDMGIENPKVYATDAIRNDRSEFGYLGMRNQNSIKISESVVSLGISLAVVLSEA